MAKKNFVSIKDKLSEEELKEFDFEKNDKGLKEILMKFLNF